MDSRAADRHSAAGRQPDLGSTTAPRERLDRATVLEIYRLRWQIELLFKRLKSLLDFDELPAHTEPLVRAWLLARLLAAALADRFVNIEPAFPPGDTALESSDRPTTSLWRWFQFGILILARIILLGAIPIHACTDPNVRCRLANPPHRRPVTHLPYTPT